jgi:hypothetical protein
MPHEEPTIHDTPPHDTAVQAPVQTPVEGAVDGPEIAAYEPVDEDEWLEDSEELPRRPRRRLLSPIPLSLLGVLLAACGFIGGVLVEKGQNPSSSSGGAATGLAARFAAARGATSGAGAKSAATGSGSGGLGSGAGFTRPTAGTVAYLAGSTLYVTNAEGNTVKVTTSPATSVTKTVKASVNAIRPGETVTITGASGSGGAIGAESISVGSSGGGLAALFGAGSRSSGAASGSPSGSSTPSLFGG